MNERIQELKHQASLWCDNNIPEQYSEETNGYGRAWEDKFAELIVRECCQFENSYGGDAGLVARSYGRKIREHFGVKE
jgi:hypothetical protein